MFPPLALTSAVLEPGTRPKVLFVDDDPLMHQLYQPHIERAGYEVVSATGGSDIGVTAERERPRVVIVDMLMPGEDGVSAILQLKTAKNARNTPVIAISSRPDYVRMEHEIVKL